MGKQPTDTSQPAAAVALGVSKNSKAALKGKPRVRVNEGAATEQRQTAGKVPVSIDDIFKQLKQPKATNQDAPLAQASSAAPAKQQPRQQDSGKRVLGSKDDLFGQEQGRARRRTEEGFAVYSEEELGGRNRGAGDTPDCPFDCDCCYF